jgi:hypothetical protein
VKELDEHPGHHSLGHFTAGTDGFLAVRYFQLDEADHIETGSARRQ